MIRLGLACVLCVRNYPGRLCERSLGIGLTFALKAGRGEFGCLRVVVAQW